MTKLFESIAGKKVSAAAAISAAVACGLLGAVYAGAQTAGTASQSQAPAGTTATSGDDYYKEEGGKVYEYDDGMWETEHDKKIENGVVYEYDDGRWEADNDWDDDWDDHDDDWDDDWDD